MELIFGYDELHKAAEKFMQLLPHHKVFAFHGQLGAGKTTFIQTICKEMNVQDRVSSPTFSIINQYQSSNYGTVYHMDLYRLNSNAEAIDAGVEDALSSGAICFIEWPEKAPILTADAIHCFMQVMPGDTRKLEIKL